MEQLLRFDERKILDFINISSPRVKKIKEKIETLTTRRREEQIGIDNILGQMKTRNVGTRTLDILQDIEVKAHRLGLDIKKLNDELSNLEPIQPYELSEIMLKFQNLITSFINNRDDEVLSKNVGLILDRVYVTRTNKYYKPSKLLHIIIGVDVEYNYPNLIALRH